MIKKLLAFLVAGTLGLLARPAFADDVAVLGIKSGEQIQRVIIEFYEDSAPNTVANFKKLAKDHFYNGLAFHRVFPHLMLQGGDPLSSRPSRSGIGTGGPGYTLPPEIGRNHIAGAVAAARLPDKINPERRSNGSQFYITLQPMPNLDGQYTVFGHVLEGMPVLDKLSTAQKDSNDKPQVPITIESIKIVARESASTKEPPPGVFKRILKSLY